jgi:hypothetical protein
MGPNAWSAAGGRNFKEFEGNGIHIPVVILAVRNTVGAVVVEQAEIDY